MNKVLMITYVFPPIAYGGVYRAVRMCKYLSRMGYDLYILTINIQKDLHNDFKLLNKIKRDVSIHRTRTLDPWRSYQKIKGKLMSCIPGKIVNKFCSLLLNLFNHPDHMICWVPFAVAKGYFLIKKNQIPVIYTSSPPHSEQIAGYLLKKMTGKKWIADLRDPILDNIIFKSGKTFSGKINSFLEKLVIANADAVIANTEIVKNRLEKRYNCAHIHTIRNSFDQEDFANVKEENSPIFTIAHVGSIYNFRKVDILFKALHKMKIETGLEPSDIKLLFVGLNDNSLKREVQGFGIEDFVEIKDVISHEEAIRIIKNSRLLLLVKGFGHNSASQIPGKMYEYLGAKRKILCIGPKNSEAAYIIKELGAGYIVEDNLEELVDILTKELQCFKQNQSKFSADFDKKIVNFSSEKMAKRLGHIIEKL